MNSNAFFDILRQSADGSPAPVPTADAVSRQEGDWQVMPLEGTFEIVYEDARGIWSARRVEARELRLGPGRTLLGGIDRKRGGYRGFRADRIRRLTDPDTEIRLEAGIFDWLLARARTQHKARKLRQRDVSRRSAKPKAEAA